MDEELRAAVMIWEGRPELLPLSHPNHDSDRFASTQFHAVISGSSLNQRPNYLVCVVTHPIVKGENHEEI